MEPRPRPGRPSKPFWEIGSKQKRGGDSTPRFCIFTFRRVSVAFGLPPQPVIDFSIGRITSQFLTKSIADVIAFRPRHVVEGTIGLLLFRSHVPGSSLCPTAAQIVNQVADNFDLRF